MFGSTILEIGIGLTFVYLLLSLVCSALNEWIAQLVAMRANTLEAGLRNLLHDPTGEKLTRELYEHPLIKPLARQGWFDRLMGRVSRPAYIPARTFALALLDIITSAEGGASPEGPMTFEDLREAIVRLPESEVRKALLVLVDEAAGNVQKARENVEQWFNDAMDRVSGWYKRRVQLILLLLAMGICAFLNIDTLMIADSLSRDVTLRAAVVAAAQEMVQQPPPSGAKSPMTWIERLQTEFQRLHLPIGWSSAPNDPRGLPQSAGAWAMKIVGLMITAIAVSLGAPFWFDVLNKLTNLRLEGRPPQERTGG